MISSKYVYQVSNDSLNNDNTYFQHDPEMLKKGTKHVTELNLKMKTIANIHICTALKSMSCFCTGVELR